MTKTHKIIISAVILAILLGVYIYFDRRSRVQSEVPITTTEATTTTQNTQVQTKTGITNVDATGGYTIEQVGPNEGKGVPQPVPDLNRKVTVYIGVTVTPEATQLATEKILSLQASLKNNTADFKSWINLGIYQKMAGDYNGAILSWQYAGRLAPTNYTSFEDLGNLYGYFLKDNGQAEIYFKLAIANGPTQAFLYVQLAEFYRDVFKDLDKARTIVNQGLSKVPNDQNLLQLQASLSASTY